MNLILSLSLSHYQSQSQQHLISNYLQSRSGVSAKIKKLVKQGGTVRMSLLFTLSLSLSGLISLLLRFYFYLYSVMAQVSFILFYFISSLVIKLACSSNFISFFCEEPCENSSIQLQQLVSFPLSLYIPNSLTTNMSYIAYFSLLNLFYSTSPLSHLGDPTCDSKKQKEDHLCNFCTN